MKYIIESSKGFEQTVTDLEAAVAANKFGVLHTHDLQATLKNKGIDFPHPCKILEVCNPQKAYAVLQEDISLNMALPCRISVWVEGGKTKIGMLSPKAILSLMSGSAALAQVAAEVEETTKRIIDQAK
ncbi:hypothetical protein MNBD_GAMMA19-1242 [hydrothermal vent metagenome]|uniref:DUF302 domain-containing protein n=1 Tax=hydrothermal vent metagenome TaxID=652676 RepID=A0A3B1AUF8_9ZZZZ